MISRKSIISCLKDLEKDPKIYACWLEGADVHGRVDKYSDIDIWVSWFRSGSHPIVTPMFL